MQHAVALFAHVCPSRQCTLVIDMPTPAPRLQCTFDAVRVAQRVEGVLAAAAVGAHIGNHDSARILACRCPRKGAGATIAEDGAALNTHVQGMIPHI